MTEPPATKACKALSSSALTWGSVKVSIFLIFLLEDEEEEEEEEEEPY